MEASKLAPSNNDSAFGSLVSTMQRLRDPQSGCPWDLAQTHLSLRDALLEETYETLEALESQETSALVEELGDLLLQIVFHAQIGSDEGKFGIGEVIEFLIAKLVRRHPHVFGSSDAGTPDEVVGQWERVKAAERKAKGEESRSMLDGVSRAMPALAYAHAVLGRARRAGFDWDDPARIFDKVAEEVGEVRNATDSESREAELGDLLLALVGAANNLQIDAESALRGANQRFANRFQYVERQIQSQGSTLAEAPESLKMELWEEAKKN